MSENKVVSQTSCNQSLSGIQKVKAQLDKWRLEAKELEEAARAGNNTLDREYYTGKKDAYKVAIWLIEKEIA